MDYLVIHTESSRDNDQTQKIRRALPVEETKVRR
jgi:hypothetical protein